MPLPLFRCHAIAADLPALISIIDAFRWAAADIFDIFAIITPFYAAAAIIFITLSAFIDAADALIFCWCHAIFFADAFRWCHRPLPWHFHLLSLRLCAMPLMRHDFLSFRFTLPRHCCRHYAAALIITPAAAAIIAIIATPCHIFIADIIDLFSPLFSPLSPFSWYAFRLRHTFSFDAISLMPLTPPFATPPFLLIIAAAIAFAFIIAIIILFRWLPFRYFSLRSQPPCHFAAIADAWCLMLADYFHYAFAIADISPFRYCWALSCHYADVFAIDYAIFTLCWVISFSRFIDWFFIAIIDIIFADYSQLRRRITPFAISH